MARSKTGSPRAITAPASDDKADELTERVLRELHALYHEPSLVSGSLGKTGLVAISGSLTSHPVVVAPRRRITVMIVGNHSAGKSSFVNFYIGQKGLMKTSVAVETGGFTLVRSSPQRMSIFGESCLVDNEHLQAVAGRLGGDRAAFVEGLRIESVPSRLRDFASIDLIDTPGLVDGNVQYGFDVNRTIVELASVCDLVLTFLDPIGQALVSRTMNVVAELNSGHAEKMRFFLTKVDTVASVQDRMKVMAQIAAQLSSRLKITHGLSIPSIAIPAGGKEDEEDEGNALLALVELLGSTVRSRAQRNLDTAVSHCRSILESIATDLRTNDENVLRRDALFRGLLPLWPVLIIISVTAFLDLLFAVAPFLPSAITTAPPFLEVTGSAAPAVAAARRYLAVWGAPSFAARTGAFLAAFLAVSSFMQLLQWRVRALGVMGREGVARLKAWAAVVETMLVRVIDLRQEFVRAGE